MPSPPPATATSLDQSGFSMKTTLVLALLVGGLAAWVLLGEQHAKTSAETRFAGKRVLPHLEPTEVTGLEIARKDQPTLILVREGSGEETSWNLTAPLADRAEPASVDRLLNNLRFAEFALRLDAQEFEALGMGETELSLTISRGEKDPYQLTFGAEHADGTFPVKVKGYEGGLKVRKSLLEANFADPLWTYRRKELFAIRHSVQVVVERTAGPTLTLARHEGFWRLDTPDGEYADPDRCNELIKEVRGLKAIAAENDAPSEADLALYGLAPPEFVLTLTPPEGKGEPEVVEVGAVVPDESGVRFARVRGRSFVYRTASAKLEEQLENEREDFRSLKLIPIAGNAQTVTGLGVLFPGDGLEWHVERQRDGGWLYRGQETRVEDLERQNLIQRIADLELLAEVQVSASDAGLDAPQAQLRVTEAELTRELQIGKQVPEEAGVYYVRRVGEERIYSSELGTAFVATLRAADLALIDKTILIASHWDAQSLELRKGETQRLKLKRVDESQPVFKQIVPEGRADKDMLTNFMQRFGQVRVESYVARDLPELYADYGLHDPLALTIVVKTYVDGGREAEEARTLYLGKREGGFVYARNPDGPSAIARIDAGFLDRAARGFTRGTKVLSVDSNSVCAVLLNLDGKLVLDLNKPEGAISWRVGSELLEEDAEEDLLKILLAFESLELTQVTDAVPDALSKHGLAPAAGTLELATRDFDTNEVTRYTILLGKPIGDSLRWAAVKGEGRLGQFFAEPVTQLRNFGAELPSAFPPR